MFISKDNFMKTFVTSRIKMNDKTQRLIIVLFQIGSTQQQQLAAALAASASTGGVIGSSHHQLAPPPQGTPAITSIAGHHPGGGGLVSALGINGGLGGLTAGQLQSLAGLGFQSTATSGASAFHRGYFFLAVSRILLGDH